MFVCPPAMGLVMFWGPFGPQKFMFWAAIKCVKGCLRGPICLGGQELGVFWVHFGSANVFLFVLTILLEIRVCYCRV